MSYARKYTNLKDGYVVRYADDFKIMCRSYTDAQRYYHATIDFLKSRLKLDISPEKSKVVNLRKNSSDFLGFKIKVLPKGKTRYGYIAKTDMSDKAIKKVTAELKAKVINIRKHTTVGRINAYNMAVMGMDEKGDEGIGMDDDVPEQGTERTETFGQNVQKSERVADKPVQRVSLKERLAEMKIKATGNSMEKSGERDKGKEEFL